LLGLRRHEKEAHFATSHEISQLVSGEDPIGAEAAKRRRKNLVNAGVAAGIGSAAIVAALLYANRGRRDTKD
jgi:hypothetical protein